MTNDATSGGDDACPPDKKISDQLKWDRANPKAKWAHMALASALRRGLIERGPCEVCGAVHGVDGAVIHGHHDDYDKPMAVRWLCMLHHRQWHAEQRRAEQEGKANGKCDGSQPPQAGL